MFVVNTSLADTSEVNKFLFIENPQPINNLEVLDASDNKPTAVF